jgi:hypothetical protein
MADNLEQLATSFLRSRQLQGNELPAHLQAPQVSAGGKVITMPPQQNIVQQATPFLEKLAVNYLARKKEEEKQEFVNTITNIMGSTAPLDDVLDESGKVISLGKVSSLQQSGIKYPEYWKEVGGEQIIKNYHEQLKRKGAISPREKIQFDIEKQKQLSELKSKTELEEKKAGAKRIAERNFNLISDASKRLSETYRDVIKEGGGGNIAKAFASTQATKVGGRFGEKFPASAAYEGQKVELITKIMPMLTQQGEKEGSVRLVSTVFDKLLKTLPGKETSPIAAKRMITETLRNMFGFASAVKELGINKNNESQYTDEQLKKIGESAFARASSIKLSPDEGLRLNQIIKEVIAPIDELIQYSKGQIINKGGKKWKVVGFDTDGEPLVEQVK